MERLTEILVEFKSEKLTLKEAKQQILDLFAVSGSAIQNKEKYKSAWTYINQTYDGESTQLGILDKTIRIASGLDAS